MRFVIESKEKDVVLRKYFVSGFGEVKRESAMQTRDGSIVHDHFHFRVSRQMNFTRKSELSFLFGRCLQERTH